MNFQIGDVIGDYCIVGVLGRGGMGRLFRVMNTLTERVEAMKIIAPEADATPDISDRFLREVKVHASMNHPNIAAVRTALHVDDGVALIMELVEGTDLDDRLRGGPMPVPEAADYVDQVLSALAYAHGHGVIHRDIKPANIIVTAGGQVKLTDFGIAHSAGDPRLTATGMAMGSLYYMSPEQAGALPIDARSDLYSLGVTLYRMVTGRYPIQGSNDAALLAGHLNYMPPSPSLVNPQIPPALSAIIMKAMEKNPDRRFQSAAEFQYALRNPDEVAAAISSPVPAALAPALSTPPAGGISPALIQEAKDKLAPFIGPIAGVVAQRMARKARTRQEFIETLAAEIPGEEDRRRFLMSF
jgi:serine/threonine-protein kinase